MRYARWGALIIALVLGGIGHAEEPLKTPNERVSEAFEALKEGNKLQEACLPLPRNDEHRTSERQAIVDAIKPFIGIYVPIVAEGK